MRLLSSLGRVAAGTALLVVAALLGVAAPASSADQTVTSFSFTSDPGDYIGQGRTRSYDASDATFSIRGTAGSLTVSVTAGTESWTASVAAPAGSQLSPGSYPKAVRSPFNGSAPGLSVTTSGRGCNQVYGSFDVTALSADSHGQVTSLDASVVQFCDSSGGALRGTIRYAAPPSGPIVLTSSNPTTVEGQAFALSAKVLPGTAAVTFLDGSTVLGTTSASNAAVARWIVETPTPGTHTYTASQNASVVSAPVTQTVLPGDTSMSYRSVNGEYIGAGATASFASPGADIRVTGSSAGLTVGVTEGGEWWYINLAPVSGQTLTTGSFPAAERASTRSAGHPGLDVFGDGRGCNTLTGSFTIDQIAFGLDGSPSMLDATWSQYCQGSSAFAMTGRVRVMAPTVQPTTTTVTASSAVGGQTTVSATVSAAAGTPTGSVTFTDGTTVLGTAPVDVSGRATVTTSLARGAHTLTGSNGGATGYARSQASTPVTVVGYATSTALSTAKTSVKAGKPVALSVAVTGGPTATGSVTLYDGATAVGTAVLAGGTATVTWTPTSRGTHTLTARYAGDASHEPSTSASLTLRVN